MNNSLSRFSGLLAITLGIDIPIGIVFYELSFRVYNRTPLLIISGFLIFIAAFLNPMLVWILQRSIDTQSFGLKQFIFLTGIFGSLIVLIGSGFDLLNTTVGYNLIIWFPLSQTQSIIAVGYAFIGLWLLLLNVQARLHDAWPPQLAWLGTIAGTIMAIALLAIPKVFIPYVSLYHELVPELGELIGDLGWRLIFPAWNIWLGFISLKGIYGDKNIQRAVPPIQ